jgi:hypothetical protein
MNVLPYPYYSLSNYDPVSVMMDQVHMDCALLVSSLDEGPNEWELRMVRCIFTSNKCYVKNVDIDSNTKRKYMYIAESSQDCNLIFIMSDGTYVLCKISDEDKRELEINGLRCEGAVFTFLLD